MARSTHIYVVTIVGGGWQEIAAAFTVKHELVTWLRANPATDYRVTRLNDGAHTGNHITELDITELLA
ncbi:hypothetical protein [Nocardia sp. NPDC060249]|uniref:hypothetical protein n=1 Tax=Nocardia sp. NPDC060249 TaxID=3347082 RepID=UPI00365C41A6